MDVKNSLPLLAAIRSGNIGGNPAALSRTAGGAAAAAMKGIAEPTAGAASAGATFSDALGSALEHVSTAQEHANAMQRDYQLGKPGASLEQTMVAMQTGQIQFQAAVTVRNRLVSAYTDIMNMPV